MDDKKMSAIAIQIIYNFYDGFYNKEYIETEFALAVEMLVENSKGRISGASQVVENGTSISYSGATGKFALTEDILALLPKKRNFKAW